MPFCPSCRYEYKAGVPVCPDCGEKLVDTLPPFPEPDTAAGESYKEWIPLVRLTSTALAEMVLESFRAKGIPTVMKSGVGHFGYVGMEGPSSFAPVGGAYTILVPREFLADATAEGKIILGDGWEKSKLVDIDQ